MKGILLIAVALATAAGFAQADAGRAWLAAQDGPARAWLALESAAEAAREIVVAPRVGPVRERDPEMRAAIESARANVDEFWRLFHDPSRGEHGFAVLIAVEGSRGTRYSWVEDLLGAGGTLSGVMSQKPLLSAGHAPKRVDVERENIVDWLYVHEGKVHGFYTLRPSMKSMTPSERERAERILDERAEAE